MKIGYARTSTIDQIAGMEAQLRDLNAMGCEKIFSEHLSSVDEDRVELSKALEFCREGDVLIVTKLDRLARSVPGFVEISQRLEKKGVSLVVQDIGLDTTGPTGRLMLNLLASIAQFEREMMLSRQKEGIAKARAEGKYKGRPKLPKEKVATILAALSRGASVMSAAREADVSDDSVYRIMRAHGISRKVSLVGYSPVEE